MRGAWVEIVDFVTGRVLRESLPVRGAWVEIRLNTPPPRAAARRSPCGERGLKYTRKRALPHQQGRSPCGERGLKSNCPAAFGQRIEVAPRAGSVG